MKERTTLKIIFTLSALGAIFSGTLSYIEVFGSAASCPALGAPGTILGYPACVYGFGMFLILTAITAYGLWGKRKNTQLPSIE